MAECTEPPDVTSLWSPVRRATFGDQLRRNAVRIPDRPAIIALHTPAAERRVVSYEELNALANRVANALLERGIGTGDVVAIMGHNCPEAVVAFWGAAKIGAAVTGVNYTFTSREIEYQLEHSGAKAILCEAAFVEKIDRLERLLPSLVLRIVNDAYSDEPAPGWVRLAELIASGDSDEPDVEVSELSLGIIPYTSGTEALPKAIAIPQRNYFVSMIPSYITGIGLLEDDVWYHTAPFHTIAGMGIHIMLMCLGNTMVLPFKTDPVEALDALIDEHITVVGQTPTFYLQVVGAPRFRSADLSSLRRAITYGGTMPRLMLEGFGSVCPKLVWVTLWSQSELTQTPTIGRFRTLADIPNGDTSWIGRPTAQLEVRVADQDGNDAPEGELLCRSPGVMSGYYKDPERTSAVLRGGWLHTGDNVRLGDQGDLFFVDRQKDLIKTGGMNVSSVEVERILYEHPSVLEVAVVGVLDDYWSQRVTAFVVPRVADAADAQELRDFCRRQLAGYKVPKDVWMVKSLPKDTQGKILKRELRREPERFVKQRQS